MEIGYSLYITGNVQPRRFQPDRLDLQISGVSFLSEIKETLIKTLTRSFFHEDLSEDFVFGLSDLAKKNPGKAQVIFNIYEVGQNAKVQTIATKHHISVTKEIIEFLDRHETLTETLTYNIN